MSLRDDLLPVLQDTRAIVDDLGFRTHDVAVVVRTWAGSRPGDPTPDAYTDASTPIAPNPRVRQVTSREVAQSGGIVSMGDLRIDKITPSFAGGGYTPNDIAPSTNGATNVEVFYRVVGPLGGDYALVTSNTDRALGYSLVVTRTLRTP